MRIRRRYAVLVVVGVVAGVAIGGSRSRRRLRRSPSRRPRARHPRPPTRPARCSRTWRPITRIRVTHSRWGGGPDPDLPRQELQGESGGSEHVRFEQAVRKTMKGAMANCGRAGRIRSGEATANGVFKINGCVLLFNGQPQGGMPTLQVFTRVQA